MPIISSNDSSGDEALPDLDNERGGDKALGMPDRPASSCLIPYAMSRDQDDHRAIIPLHGDGAWEECISTSTKNPQCVRQVTLREKVRDRGPACNIGFLAEDVSSTS